MADSIFLDFGQGVQAASGCWYRNVETLGVGGNAVTFLVVATNGPHRGVPFALKAFRRRSKPERRKQLAAEFDFLKTCDHPSIMQVFDRGEYRGEHPFLVAEYLPNTLTTRIRANLTTVQRVTFVLQLLSALDYLSRLNPPIIHRDIKPQNIFIKGGSCVLGDFGLMKRAAEESEDKEIMKESYGAGMPFFYRSPDQVDYLAGKVSLTVKSDVFQLGLVAAELFTGWTPARHVKEFTDPVELEPIRRIPGAAGGTIAELIRRMLSIRPEDRPTATDLIDRWQSVFFKVAGDTRALEGHVHL